MVQIESIKAMEEENALQFLIQFSKLSGGWRMLRGGKEETSAEL